MDDKTLVERLMEFEKFIRGQDALDGSWFGDTRSDIKGAFWWRRFSPIKEAADTIEAQATRIEALEAALRDAAKAERDGLDAAYLEAFDVHMSLIVTNWPKIKHVPTAIALAAKTMDAMVSFQTLRELPDDVVNAVKEAAKEHTDDVDIDWQEIITALADALESKP